MRGAILACLAVIALANVCMLLPATESAYKPIGFEQLSNYNFEVTGPSFIFGPAAKRKPPKQVSRIPDQVRALDGKKVEIIGYMLPLEQGEGMKVRKFILMRSQITCCFGGANRVNEFVMVTMRGKGAMNFETDVPIKVKGTLFVGARLEGGSLSSLYQMNGETAAQL